jgi:hypothetical protein
VIAVAIRGCSASRRPGARAVEPIAVDGMEGLAIPQLAYDVAGQEPSMHGGDSTTELLLLRRDEGRFTPAPEPP